MSQEIITKKGPKSKEDKQVIIKQIVNQIITGEIHERTLTDNAKAINISRYTYREYLPMAYSQIDLNPETQIKKVKDTRQFLIDNLLNDFKRCEDPIQRNLLSKNISSLLDSQEKSSLLIMQHKKEEESKEKVITSGTGLFTDYLSKIPNPTITKEDEKLYDEYKGSPELDNIDVVS